MSLSTFPFRSLNIAGEMAVYESMVRTSDNGKGQCGTTDSVLKYFFFAPLAFVVFAVLARILKVCLRFFRINKDFVNLEQHK